MENMYMHQHAKAEPNRSTDGTATSTDARTHSPPTQTLFYHKSMHFILEYLSYTYLWSKRKFPEVYRLIITPYIYSK